MDQSPSPIHSDPKSVLGLEHHEVPGETIFTVMWRYKWLVLILLPASVVLGYWINRQKPMTFRATGQMLLKSDIPLTSDSSTGIVRGGIPDGKLMQALITSDLIAGRVKLSDQSREIESLKNLDDDQFVALVRKGIQYQTVTAPKHSRDRIVASINYDGRDPDVCVAVVNAVSSALGEHFREESQQRVNEFEGLISDAQKKLLPQQTALEAEYQRFRETAPLEWDPAGKVVNPHRQRVVQLQQFRDQLEQKRHSVDCELRFAERMNQRHDNPLMVAMIIGKLSDVFEGVGLVEEGPRPTRPATDDLELMRIAARKKLLPLEIEREQLELAFGWSHPKVRAIANQIDSTHRKLNELNVLAANRQEELEEQSAIEGSEFSHASQVARADEAVKAFIHGLGERLRVTTEDIESTDRKIIAAKHAADELKKFEDKDASFRRRIASVEGMLIQLEQQLAKLKLIDVEGGITVNALRDTVKAFATGPDLNEDLAMFAMLGLGLSGLLAFALEAGAMTFRSADSIERDLKSPVLTHIPVDTARLRKHRRNQNPAIARLDPRLASVHRPYSPAAEAVRGVRTAMLLDRMQNGTKVVQITSPLPGDGKSTLAANLGCSIAQSGKRTLLIDLDLRSPRLSLRFNLNTETGLANVLNGELKPAEAVHQAPIENLDILPCGPLPSNPAEALTLAELGEVFNWARENYDFIIVDTPPLLMVSDPTIVTSYVDAAILVMRIRRRCKPNAKEAVAMLRWSGSRVVGVVINKFKANKGAATYKSSASGSYQSIGYGYGDKYRRRYQREVNARDTYVVRGSTAKGRVDIIDSAKKKPIAHPQLQKHHTVAQQKRSSRV